MMLDLLLITLVVFTSFFLFLKFIPFIVRFSLETYDPCNVLGTIRI